MGNEAAGVAALVLNTVLQDRPWQDFGFRKRPNFAKIPVFFRASWRVAAERRVLREMVCVFGAIYVRAGVITEGDIDALAQFLAGAATMESRVWAWYGFLSYDEAYQYFLRQIRRYVEARSLDLPKLLVLELQLGEMPDKGLVMLMTDKALRFGFQALSMVQVVHDDHLASRTTKGSAARSQHSPL